MLWASLHNPQKACNNAGILSDCFKIPWAWEMNWKQPFMVVFSCLHFLKRTFYRTLIEYNQPPHTDFVSSVKWACACSKDHRAGIQTTNWNGGGVSAAAAALVTFPDCWAAEHAETFSGSKHCPWRQQSLKLFLRLESSGPASAALSTSETRPFWWWIWTQGSGVCGTASVNGSSHGQRGLSLYFNFFLNYFLLVECNSCTDGLI